MKRSILAAAAACLIVGAVIAALIIPGSGCSRDAQHRCSSFGAAPKGVARLAPPLAQSVPSLEMFDSVSVGAPPSSARAIAGYTSGSWPTFNGLVARFPHAYHVPISISTASPIARAGVPCVYANLSTMGAVRASLAGVPRSRYLLWVALWTFHPGLVAGYDAVQWTDRSQGNNDESTVTLDFLRRVGQCLDVEPGDATPSQAGGWVKAHLAPEPKPQVQVAGYYLTRRFKLPAGQSASERNTVLAWKKHSCVNPVQRPVCRSTHWHLQLLADRDLFVATHHPVRGHWVPIKGRPRWGFPDRQHPLGSRYAGMNHWLDSRKNPCPTPEACMP